MQLPTDRTVNNSPREHVDDHNELHRLHNLLDGVTYYGAGLIADRPPAVDVADGFEYLATNVDGGTPYRAFGGVWSQSGGSVNGGGGGRETQRVEFGTFDTATGGARQPITGATFPAAVPLTSLPQDLEVILPSIQVHAWGGSAIRASAIVTLYTSDGVTLLALRGLPPVTKIFPKNVNDPGAPQNVAFAADVAQLNLPSFKHRIAASAASINYRLEVQVFANDAADVAVTDVVVRIGSSSLQQSLMRVVTVAP